MKIKTLDTNRNIAYERVTDKWDTLVLVEDQRTVTFINGVTVNCSKNHPFMILENDDIVTVKPDFIEDADVIVADNGTTSLLDITGGAGSTSTAYIDITVASSHTFFASNSETGPMVLTHNSQGGVRGGAATIYYPIWHYEVEDLLVLKNNKGTEDNRIRHMDYGVQFNKVIYERLLSGGNITLFSPKDVPGLYQSFFTDVDTFRKLYKKYENDINIRKKTIPAIELFSTFMQERKDTGRVYLMNVDHCNDHGSFIKELAPVRMSNLCCEITLPTTPLKDINDGQPIVKIMKMTKEQYEKYLNWKKHNPNTPIESG